MSGTGKLAKEFLQIAAGLMVFSLGVHLTIYADIGLAPWDCLGMGLAGQTGLKYGTVMTLIALAVLGIDLLLGERIGFGTIIDALLTGNFVQLFNDLNPLKPNGKLLPGIGWMTLGFVLMALGMMIYMKAGHCCGPRDSLLVGLGRRLPRMPIGLVEVLLWGAVLLIGWLLGGPVGIGTLYCTAAAGAVMELVYRVCRFDPREVKHRNVAEALRGE